MHIMHNDIRWRADNAKTSRLIIQIKNGDKRLRDDTAELIEIGIQIEVKTGAICVASHLSFLFCDNHLILGAFLVIDNRVLKGSLGRSLRSFARTAHSLRSLATFMGLLTHFANSLVGQLKFLKFLNTEAMKIQ